MKKIFLTFTFLTMLTLIPTLGFTNAKIDNETTYLKGVSWGDSYHDVSLNYSGKPLLEIKEANLKETLTLYGQKISSTAITHFYNDRLFMIEYPFEEPLSSQQYNQISTELTDEFGKAVVKDNIKGLNQVSGWVNKNIFIMLNKDAIRYLNTKIVDSFDDIVVLDVDR